MVNSYSTTTPRTTHLEDQGEDYWTGSISENEVGPKSKESRLAFFWGQKTTITNQPHIPHIHTFTHPYMLSHAPLTPKKKIQPPFLSLHENRLVTMKMTKNLARPCANSHKYRSRPTRSRFAALASLQVCPPLHGYLHPRLGSHRKRITLTSKPITWISQQDSTTCALEAALAPTATREPPVIAPASAKCQPHLVLCSPNLD